MNIQGYVSAWRPSNTNYAMARSKNSTEKADAFGSILNSNSVAQTKTETFANMSFEDIMNSGYGRNAIPTVNQIVSSSNAIDEEIYLTYFTDDRITCNYADGRKAWEIEIKDEQRLQKVKEFFDNYTPDENWVNTEYYSGNNMGMAVQKSFWLDLFHN